MLTRSSRLAKKTKAEEHNSFVQGEAAKVAASVASENNFHGDPEVADALNRASKDLLTGIYSSASQKKQKPKKSRKSSQQKPKKSRKVSQDAAEEVADRIITDAFFKSLHAKHEKDVARLDQDPRRAEETNFAVSSARGLLVKNFSGQVCNFRRCETGVAGRIGKS